MADFSPNQKRIIERYYDNRDDIMLTRLEEVVTELYLAETEAKIDRLWKRVEKAVQTLKVAPAISETSWKPLYLRVRGRHTWHGHHDSRSAGGSK